MDDTTTPQGTLDSSRQRLTQQLTSAWSAIRPATAPPADWLDVAVTALTATASPDGPGECDRVNATDLARWQDIAAQLRRLHAEIRDHASAAATRRSQLDRLQALVRLRAIAQLNENPHLEGPLRDALAEWGLPPIDNDNDEDEDSDT